MRREDAQAEELYRHHRGPSVLCYPNVPTARHVLGRIAKRLELRVSRKPGREPDLAVRFERQAEVARQYRQLRDVDCVVVNGQLRGSGKHLVADAFYDAFDYPLAVDPTTHEGPLVEKSNRNAQHDGRVVLGPIEPVPGKVYTVLVDNEDGDEVVDFRCPVIGETIPFVYEKRQPLSDRFGQSGATDRVVALRDPTEVFSATEIDRILTMARVLGADLAELDVLRDRSSGRIYIVDANPTAAARWSWATDEQARWAVDVLAATFEAEFLVPDASVI